MNDPTVESNQDVSLVTSSRLGLVLPAIISKKLKGFECPEVCNVRVASSASDDLYNCMLVVNLSYVPTWDASLPAALRCPSQRNSPKIGRECAGMCCFASKGPSSKFFFDFYLVATPSFKHGDR